MINNIEESIKSIISKQLNIKKEKIINNASFVEDLGADSLDTVELIMSLEEKFNIEISDEESEKITNVKSAINFIKKKINKK